MAQSWDRVDELLSDAVDTVFPGAACAVIDDETVGYSRCVGSNGQGTPVSDDTIFDVASLTKVMATATTAMILHSDHRLPLDVPVCELDSRPISSAQITVRRLLSHTSGLPAWQPFYAETSRPLQTDDRRRGHVLRRARATPLAYEPGTQAVYSDVGFIVLADVIERVLTERLDQWCVRELFTPLGMQRTFFVRGGDSPFDKNEFAATEVHNGHGALVGVVHDDNARAMGGVAGHAGLFSTLADVVTFARTILNVWHGRSQVFHRDTLRMFAQRHDAPEGTTRCLGWDSVSEEGSSTGSRFATSSIGHLGFTGCSLWIDLENEVAVVLLSNRVHPTRTNHAIRAFRPRLHDAIREALGR